MVWHPGVVGITGVVVNVAVLILYSTLNPLIAGTEGSVNAEAQVLKGACRIGFSGYTKAFTVVSEHPVAVLVVPAKNVPQSAANT